MGNLTEVVKTLIILNVIMFIGFNIAMPHYAPLTHLYYPGFKDVFQPYQIVSHMFMHGGPMHILFNMMTLFFLGPAVEQGMGPKRFLILYFISGLAAAGLHMGLAYVGVVNPGIRIVGASGAIMGVFAAFGVMYPNTKLMLMFIPFPIKAQHLLIGTIVISLGMGIANFSDGIAHYAHLGGALCGFILTMIWYGKRPNISA